MLTLAYVPKTRASRVRWMLEELAVPYELLRLDPKAGETKAESHRMRHPLGHVPALVDGDTTLIESMAIVQYLADKFAEKHLAPAPGTPERGQYYQWMTYVMVNLEPQIAAILDHEKRLPEADRSPAMAARARKRWAEVLAPLEAHLAKHTYVVGETFTAADIIVAGVLVWSRGAGLLNDYPHSLAYVTGCYARPACVRAIAD